MRATGIRGRIHQFLATLDGMAKPCEVVVNAAMFVVALPIGLTVTAAIVVVETVNKVQERLERRS